MILLLVVLLLALLLAVLLLVVLFLPQFLPLLFDTGEKRKRFGQKYDREWSLSNTGHIVIYLVVFRDDCVDCTYDITCL